MVALEGRFWFFDKSVFSLPDTAFEFASSLLRLEQIGRSSEDDDCL